ncbi:MAG: hypothetical protein LQ339_002705 [Xanthoria mediterranea]|nr:MAG: hypothetical protein LQ339_002705 [Xanthoria mediterranea]
MMDLEARWLDVFLATTLSAPRILVHFTVTDAQREDRPRPDFATKLEPTIGWHTEDLAQSDLFALGYDTRHKTLGPHSATTLTLDRDPNEVASQRRGQAELWGSRAIENSDQMCCGGPVDLFSFGKKEEPELAEVLDQRRPSNVEAMNQQHRKSVSNRGLTGASALTVKQSIFPITLVTILFFLWGFVYGLLDALNAKFQNSLGITSAKAGGLQGAYFGAYLIGPPTYSGWIVRKFGYRWTFITGLCIYGLGALMFWPSAVKRSFAGFCGSLFIVGSGLSTLEASANPFIATCGPPRLSEFRLELSQSFQAIGSVMAPLLASRVFFTETDPTDLSNVQWTYLGI